MSEQPPQPQDRPLPDEAREPEERDTSLDRRLQAVAEHVRSDPDRMEVLSESVRDLPHSGRRVRFFKVFVPQDQRSPRVALDEADRVVDVDEVLEQEAAAARRRYGALQPALHALLEQVSGEDRRIPVLLRYHVTDDGDGLDKLDLDGRDLDDDRMAEIGRRVARREAELAERARALHLETMRDVGVDLQDDGGSEPAGPFVHALLGPEALRALARDGRVAFIGMAREEEVPDYPTIPESLPTTRTQTVHASGFRGSGIRIAVLEGGTPNVAASNFRLIATQDTNAAANDHMTKSLGIIGNRWSGSWEGYAPDAGLLLANASDYQDRYRWARDRNVNVVTMSWHFPSEETDGGLHSRDVFFDYMALRWPYPSIFTSAGNEADSDAFASGKGYNLMGVGNVVNEDDGDRCDDVISSSSSWKNPTSPHGDHEVPAIAAPGSRHAVLGSSFGGTSCATPVTASIAAVLMSCNPSLKIWPEAIRAILLATANYQDADGADYSRFADGKDGAGMVNTLYGMWTAGRRESNGKPQFRAHDFGRIRHADFSGGYLERSWTARVATSQSRMRVALAWNSRTIGIFGVPLASVLDADLDLHVFGPDGSLVATGSSWDNSWELVEFTPRQVGAYTIRVRGYNVPRSFESWFGVAWTAHYDLC
ncbi:MAG: S8 family peptidase [Kineosporiaceae bacterium]